MYICNDCGETFNKPITSVDCDGNYEIPATREALCPYCKSYDFEEAKECPICGKYINSDCAVCEECIDKNRTLENVIGIESNLDSIQINPFWLSVYGNNQINQILQSAFEEIPDCGQQEYIDNYINEDKSSFAEYLIEKED